MAKELSRREAEALSDVDSRLAEFKEQVKKMSAEERKAELDDLKAYLDGCLKGEIDDVLSNIQLCDMKIQFLESQL